MSFDTVYPFSYEWAQEMEAMLPLVFMLLMTLIVFRAMQSIDLYTASRAARGSAHESERRLRESMDGVEGRLASLEESREFSDSLLLSRGRRGEPRRLIEVADAVVRRENAA